ncbi:MAG: diacylglycerol/lipid kinase family protein, partial [Nitrososphaeraceae archaeon]
MLSEKGGKSVSFTASRIHKQNLKKKLKNVETLLVINPTSSSGSTGKDWENLYIKMKDALGKDPRVVFTKKANDGALLTRKFLKRGVKKVIAIGGDGTINEVANGFFLTEEKHSDNKKPVTFSKNNNGSREYKNGFPQTDILMPINSEAIFGIIPSGTRNVLAKSLNLPQGISYMKGITRKIDVLTATVTNPSDRSKVPTRAFLNAAEIGFGAEVIDRSKRVRNRIKNRMVSTVTSVIATLPTYESNNCEIVFDDGQEKVVTKMTMGVIANGKFLGGGFMAAPEASFSDGLLDVVILRDSGSLKMLDKLANIKTGDYTDEVDVIYKQARKVSIKSNERDITVAIDGEPIGILPATFQVNQYPLN